jgi:hypothetical protein
LTSVRVSSSGPPISNIVITTNHEFRGLTDADGALHLIFSDV